MNIHGNLRHETHTRSALSTFRQLMVAGFLALSAFVPSFAVAGAGCGTSQVDLSGLWGLWVSASSRDDIGWIYNPDCDACPVSVRIHFMSHVDTASDQQEDITWFRTDFGSDILTTAATNAPDNYFQGKDIESSRTVQVSSRTPLWLSLENIDWDSYGANRDTNRQWDIWDSDSTEVNTWVYDAELVSDFGSCPSIPGAGGSGILSAMFGVNLGLTDHDVVAGTLGFHANLPTAALVTPAGLSCNAQAPGVFNAASGVEAVVTNSAFRQFLTPACFADIVTVSASSYEIRFYATN